MKKREKKRINKFLIIVIILIIILAIATTIITKKIITGKAIDDQINIYCHTKAICDKNNVCQDFEVTCNGNKTISAKPITGAVVKFDVDWEDPRGKPEENLCL